MTPFSVETPTTSELANLLRQIYPVQGLVFVGAGDGRSVTNRFQNWNIANALLVEASPEYMDELTNNVDKISGWKAVQGLVGEDEMDQDFYVASNPNESSVIAPVNFQSIWPHLHEKSCLRLKQQSLCSISNRPVDEQLDNRNTLQNYSDYNWLVVDCLPALPILKGAVEILEQYDVVWLKVILNEKFEIKSGSGLKEVDAFILSLGFHQLMVTESNHPAVGNVLYAKKWKQCFALRIDMMKQRDAKNHAIINEQEKLLEDRNAQVEQLTNTRDEQLEKIKEQGSQVLKLKALHAEQDKLLEDRNAQVEQLTNTRDGQLEKIKEQGSQVLKLKALHAEQERLLEDGDAQIKQLKEVRAQQSEKLNEHNYGREELENRIKHKDKRIGEQAEKLTEQDVLQKSLNEEIIKAEAQIELIRDVLLRESGL